MGSANQTNDTLNLTIALAIGSFVIICICVCYYLKQRNENKQETKTELGTNISVKSEESKKDERIEMIANIVQDDEESIVDQDDTMYEHVNNEQTNGNIVMYKRVDVTLNSDPLTEAKLGNTKQATQETTSGYDNGIGGEDEGSNPYSRIDELLKAVYKQEYTEEHLKRFRAMLVDDAKVFEDVEFMKMFPMDHEIWTDLLPGNVARSDFFFRLKAHPSYAD